MESGCATSASYPYLALTDNCRCEEFRIRDNKVEYLFRARYSMRDGIVSDVDIEFTNNSEDTLSLDVASVKISSRNVSYQYNDKFIPLPSITVAPHRSETVQGSGKDVAAAEDWHKIAGERLTVTVRGMRLGEKELKQQQVEFVPENPKMKR